ncbi:1,4-dihydroxy-2-naphthoate polyprenyltransferase [Pseudonocardiaceae bacterium YIM PH 21723]|nr:1,4-dihydroxy-2-naphthoate polyprenyltransferase [Pseudonocardiaceae bacterium YIM PH 21723]
MATLAHWVEGARPRTLPNAIAPVLVGAGAAQSAGSFSWGASLLALLVAVCMVIGVNYANDYSDGVRGTDDDRTGPIRMVGSKTVSPWAVRNAAVGFLALGGVSGLLLVIITGRWLMLVVGAICIAAAWFYTGGKRPYGYEGFGEVAVFLFFGPVAVLGTLYVQAGSVNGSAIGAACGVGCFSAAVLVSNNLRDIPNDTIYEKNTLAVLLGDRDTRHLWVALVVIPFLMTLLLGFAHPIALIGFLAVPLVIPPAKRIIRGEQGRELIPVLRDTGLAMLAWSAATGIGLALS